MCQKRFVMILIGLSMFGVSGCYSCLDEVSYAKPTTEDMAAGAGLAVFATTAAIAGSVASDARSSKGKANRPAPGSSYNMEAPTGSVYYKTSDGRVVIMGNSSP